MYNRLFTKILDSSIWLEDHATVRVWITLIAAMDEDGVATFACAKNLAIRAHVSDEEITTALNCLMSPDENSYDPEFDGRRVEKIPGGYLVLNAIKYRELFSRELRREQTRLRVAKHRENVTRSNESVTQSEAIEREHEQAKERSEAQYQVSAEDFKSAWNQLPEPFSKIRSMSPGRVTSLRARLRDTFWKDNWREAIARLPKCGFTSGQNNRGWVADVDFFLQPDSVAKVMENKYEQRRKQDGTVQLKEHEMPKVIHYE